MKKGMCLLLSGMMVLSIAACGANGGGTSGSSANSHSDAVLSNEELIASAQNIYIGDFERTLGEYMEAATEVPQKSWYVVSEETADSDTLDELEDLYDPDEERLVCADISSFDIEFYIAVESSTGISRLVASFSGYGENEEENLASFLNRCTSSTLSTEEIEEAVHNSYLPGYPDQTLGTYVEQATLVAGSSGCTPLPLNQAGQLLLIHERCSDFDIIADRVQLMTVWIDDLQGNHQLTYRFYVAVDRNTGESEVVAASAASWENGREGDSVTRYGSDVEEIADIFMEAANWAG